MTKTPNITAALSLLFLLCPLPLFAARAVETTPTPVWVDPIAPADKAVQNEPTPGQGSVTYILVNQQAHIEEQTYYSQYVTRINTPAGVEDFSQLSFDFQPDYETLTFHTLDVIRDGVPQDRLKDTTFELIRQEKGLDRQLYNGETTAHVILDDIRPGDTLSYSFSTQGANPVFKGHIHKRYRLAYGVEIGLLHRSTIWDPNQRELTWQVLGSTDEPTVTDLSGGLGKITLDKPGLKGIQPEDNTPGSVLDYPWLEISDYTSWEDFGKWCLGIYETGQPLPAEMKTLCEAFKAKGGTNEELITRTLFWVQENVRYLGSFLGEHTHEPHLLKDIARRRFGDCKDKGILTIAMLRHLGFDAAPALVNTYNGDGILRYLPGHGNFDHLIVHLRLGGETYWLDPTATFKRGRLQDLYTPDYRHAFVIRPGRKALTELKPRGLEANHVKVTETFTVPDMKGSATLKVRTIATGREADILRRTLATDPWREIQEDYREYYQKYYPGIEAAGDLSSTDDQTANRITITESYNISGFWTEQEADDGGTELYGRFYAGYLESSMNFPDKQKRKHPYASPHPRNLSYRIVANLPEPWNLDLEDEELDIPAFRFTYASRSKRKQLRINYDLKTNSKEIPVADFPEYQKATDTMAETLSYGLIYTLTTGSGSGTAATQTPAQEDTTNKVLKSRILLGTAAFISVIVSLIIATALYFWNPRIREVEGPAPVGLGGWMILPIIGAVLTPFVLIKPIVTAFTEIDADFTLFDDLTHPIGLKLYDCSIILTNVLLLCLSILLLILLIRRRTSFPYVFIGILCLTIASQLLLLAFQDFLSPGLESTRTAEIRRAFIQLLLWGTYMGVSKRVKATFTNRLGKQTLPAPPPLPPNRPEQATA